ncbi:hypothetical protein FA13DRAFT_1716763 [Coprinellus micaceus]|uniref:Uncharacterized protein n=1 Tax=Coprinellus micaceus TaxID=71717 RepID=A0A4Y7SIB9_COPMI|nr:hypothetical protein FA13DRAFT_1716763 [Coprinellus micaceus]
MSGGRLRLIFMQPLGETVLEKEETGSQVPSGGSGSMAPTEENLQFFARWTDAGMLEYLRESSPSPVEIRARFNQLERERLLSEAWTLKAKSEKIGAASIIRGFSTQVPREESVLAAARSDIQRSWKGCSNWCLFLLEEVAPLAGNSTSTTHAILAVNASGS